MSHHPIVSLFSSSVSNITSHTDLSWPELCALYKKTLKELPKYNSDNWQIEKEHTSYIVRGLIENGQRCDENLSDTCELLPLDIDEEPIPPIKKVRKALNKTGAPYILHSTATPGRYRILLLVKPYQKNSSQKLNIAAEILLAEHGITLTIASESSTKSQAMFTPQVSKGKSSKCYIREKGKPFDWSKYKEKVKKHLKGRREDSVPYSSKGSGYGHTSVFIDR